MVHTISMEDKQILFEEEKCSRKVILNRPRQLNCVSYEMISQMLKMFEVYEKDSTVGLVILKGNGRAFCSGGDVKSVVKAMLIGHWSFGANFYRKQLTLDYILATYKKPVVSILDGIIMGGGAGISLQTPFRVVTENSVFAMPEASIGLFPDCGASHFLSRLPGFFGEYLGLTGAQLDGTEMLACGLATHFVLSKDLGSMEEALDGLMAPGLQGDVSNISDIINEFVHKVDLKKDSAFTRLDIINQFFSADTIEEILSSLEKLAAVNEDKWITKAIKSLKSASPTNLKIFLRLIRKGRTQSLQNCLVSEFRALCHTLRGTVTNDFYEGSRAKLIEKDGNPKWNPSRIELVSNEMVDKYFCDVEDDDGKPLQLPARPSHGGSVYVSKL